MIKWRKILFSFGICASALSATGVSILWLDHRAVRGVRAVSGHSQTAPGVHLASDQNTQIPPGVLTALAQQKLDGLNASDKESVSTFLTTTPGPLDNYLLNLEAMTEVANARYGEPDPVPWARALPIARVLQEGMCDCAQRNWLNQFIALGESGLKGDLANYHAQGEVMATVGRFNGDSIDKQAVTNGRGQ